MSDELKPCPFCGSADLLVGDGAVECGQCYSSTGMFVHVLGEHNNPDQDAIKAWNTRIETSDKVNE